MNDPLINADLDMLQGTSVLASPVPPAGDVECAICLSLGDQCVTCEESEFKAWAEKHFASPDYSQTSAGVYIKDWMRHSFAAWQARSKVVTRLTAERGGLLAEVASLQALVNQDLQQLEQMDFELTKARELIADVVATGGELSRAGLKRYADYLAHNVDESCGQDAEAAKLEPAVDCGDCPIITDGCRGICMKAPAAKGGECKRIGCSHEMCGERE